MITFPHKVKICRAMRGQIHPMLAPLMAAFIALGLLLAPIIHSAVTASPEIPLFDRDKYSAFELSVSSLNDGIPDAWKFHYGLSMTDPSVANADYNGTGIMNVEKFQLNLHPLASVPKPATPVAKPKAAAKTTSSRTATSLSAPLSPSILNGGFGEVNNTTWTSGAGANYLGGSAGNFKYAFINNDKVTGWKAFVGSKMEVWIAGGQQFVELDASAGNHGVKQPVQNAVAGTYLLTWKHLGRNNAAAGNNGYRAIVYTEGPGGVTDRIQLAEKSYPASGSVSVTQWTPQIHTFIVKEEDLAPLNAPARTLWIAYDSNDNNTYGSLIDEVNLALLEFVTKGSEGENIPQSFTWNSVSVPVVEITNASAQFTANGSSVAVSIAGMVTDASSDCTPSAGKQVSSLFIEGPGVSVTSSISNVGHADPGDLWRPYSYAGEFSNNFTVQVGNGEADYTVRLSTSQNAGGMAGGQELLVRVNTASTAGQDYLLTFPIGYDDSQPGTVNLEVGHGTPAAQSITLHESATGSKTFSGSVAESTYELSLENFSALTAAVDSFKALITVRATGALAKTLQLALVETGAATNSFEPDTQQAGNSKQVSLALMGSSAPGNFHPTMVRMKGEVATFTGTNTIKLRIMDRDWNMKYNQIDGGYWYAVDDNDKPVVFNPSLNAHTDIQTKKVDETKGFEVKFLKSTGEVAGTATLNIVQGLVVHGDDVSDLLGKVTGWEKKKFFGSSNDGNYSYLYKPKKDTAIGHDDETLDTEIFWRFVGTNNTVVIFNSRQELLNDVNYRKAVCDACLNKFKFEFYRQSDIDNQNYFERGNPNFWVGGRLPYGPVGLSPDALNNAFDPATDPTLYSFGCYWAVTLVQMWAASQVLPLEDWRSRFSVIEMNGFLSAHRAPGTPSKETAVDSPEELEFAKRWIPGDQGYILAGDVPQNNPKLFTLVGENVIYVGGDFSEDLTSSYKPKFFGHHPNKNKQMQSLLGWQQEVATYAQQIPPELRILNGRIKTQGYHYFLRQPFKKP